MNEIRIQLLAGFFALSILLKWTSFLQILYTYVKNRSLDRKTQHVLWNLWKFKTTLSPYLNTHKTYLRIIKYQGLLQEGTIKERRNKASQKRKLKEQRFQSNRSSSIYLLFPPLCVSSHSTFPNIWLLGHHIISLSYYFMVKGITLPSIMVLLSNIGQ